jgi:hypothetical protein
VHQSALGLINTFGGADLGQGESRVEHWVGRFQLKLGEETIDPFVSRPLFGVRIDA